MLPRIYHKLCSLDILRECTMRWLHHTVCKGPPVRKRKTSLQSLISFLTTKSYLITCLLAIKTIRMKQAKNTSKSSKSCSVWEKRKNPNLFVCITLYFIEASNLHWKNCDKRFEEECNYRIISEEK